jgi:hypothetical protein
MAHVVKLIDEKVLITGLKQDTLQLIRRCDQVEPIKKFVACYDILDLTLEIQHHYPRLLPEVPECDLGALHQLRILTQELLVYHWIDLPNPEFPNYTVKIHNLFRMFKFPREEYDGS